MAKDFETKKINPAGDQYNLVPAKDEIDQLERKRSIWGWTFLASALINAVVISKIPEHFYSTSNILHSGVNEMIVVIQIVSFLLPLRNWDSLGFKIRDQKLLNSKKQ